jgi:hypothetical protein
MDQERNKEIRVMSNYATQEEMEAIKALASRAHIQASIAMNFASVVMMSSNNLKGIVANLEKSREAGVTTLIYSKATDEDIAFCRELFGQQLDLLRILASQQEP